ncbi:MAG: DUF4221 family protein [Mongoliitalea sp.]
MCSSCKNESAPEKTVALNYSIDTVLIDSKNEILFLQRDLYTSDYSEYDGMLYNLNDRTNQIEQINLDNLTLEKTVPFEKEGPNGTGFWTSDLQAISKNAIFLGGERSGIYNLQGELLHRFDWNAVPKEKGGILDEERVFYQVANPNFPQEVFAIVVYDFANSVTLRQLDSSSETIKSYNIDPQENYKTYTLGDLSNYNKWDPRIYLKSIEDHIIVSHEYSNDFYIVFPAKDSVVSTHYNSPLLPSKVSPTTEGDLINSLEDRKNALRNYRNQITYGPIVFDKTNERYVRLAASIQYGDQERERYILPEIKNSMLYLSIFDENFNHLLDQEIPEIAKTGIPKYFMREGALWMYVNIEDELGFIRIWL